MAAAREPTERPEDEMEPLLPRAQRSHLEPKATGKHVLQWLEDSVAFTPDETEAHQRLLDLASVSFSRDVPAHEELVRSLWDALLSGEYEPRSKRWRELGFQADDPRTDLRGSGYLALRCLCFLANNHRDEARRMFQENESLLFAAACINVCGILVVHLELNGQSVVSPVSGVKPACSLALKKFTRDLANRETEFEFFGEVFVATVRKMSNEWRSFCMKRPDANLLHFGEVLQRVGTAVEFAFGCSATPIQTIEVVDPGSCWTRLGCFVARIRSAILVAILHLARCLCGLS